MTEDEEYEYDEEELRKQRQNQKEYIENSIERLKEKLPIVETLRDSRKKMHEVSQDNYEILNPLWAYQKDEEWIEAHKQFQEARYKVNKVSDEQQVKQLESKIEQKKTNLEQLKREIEELDKDE